MEVGARAYHPTCGRYTLGAPLGAKVLAQGSRVLPQRVVVALAGYRELPTESPKWQAVQKPVPRGVYSKIPLAAYLLLG